MRILVTGVSGQLGSEFCRFAEHDGCEVVKLTRAELDLEKSTDDIRRIISESRVDWVVNCAAYTNVDKAENEPDRALTINCDAVGAIAHAVTDAGERLLHVSTDYVFAGDQCTPYSESDATAPLNSYGESKLQGEQSALEGCSQAVILRTGWVYGARGHNFVKTMLRLAAERDVLQVVDDLYGSPSWTRDIASAMLALIRNDCDGVYHYSNEGVASWYDFAVAVFEIATELGAQLRVNKVVPIATKDFPTNASRPAYSVLNKTKIRQVMPQAIPHWRSSLRHMLEELYS
jgi:dTDP-4-dehydrorhamnose reductase